MMNCPGCGRFHSTNPFRRFRMYKGYLPLIGNRDRGRTNRGSKNQMGGFRICADQSIEGYQ